MAEPCTLGIISTSAESGDSDDNYVLLTDIQGLEDFFGDMDFKVTGTETGITAIQMDIKINGLTREIVEGAIETCRQARLFIMDTCMKPCINEPRPEIGEFAPKIEMISIDPAKIGDVVGKQGKVINKIIEETKVKIDIDEDGKVSVFGPDREMIFKAIEIIKSIVTEVEEGMIFKGRVVRIADFGAFVELAPNKDGMLHISKISDRRIDRVEDVLSIGDEVTVKVVAVDNAKGRISLSMKSSDFNDRPEVANHGGDDGTADNAHDKSRSRRRNPHNKKK